MIDIYLACPCSAPDPKVREQRFNAVNDVAARIMKTGRIVFSPISHTHPIAEAGDLPKGWDFWERFDTAYLSMSKELWILPLEGWKESRGVQAEVAIAKKLGLDIYVIHGNELVSFLAAITLNL